LPLQRHQPEILDKVGECTYDTKTSGPLPAVVAANVINCSKLLAKIMTQTLVGWVAKPLTLTIFCAVISRFGKG
jgi:hypothetical protein